MRPWPWLEVRPEGLHVRIGTGLFIDPARPVARAVVSHGHSDHARPGHGEVWATAETLAIMRLRLGAAAAGAVQRPLAYGERVMVEEGVTLWLAPAGHVLGSAQVVLEHGGRRVVYAGDYKRRLDPTCAAFTPVTPCDLLITEATFGLPVFRHPPVAEEVERLLRSRALFPARCHLVGVYALGKAQRLIAELRLAGYRRPLWLHGALLPLCRLYEAHGVPLGELRPAAEVARREDLAGEIVLAPPSALAGPWARRLPEPVIALASGWMRVRQRAKARGVELPLVISDHADWDELLQTLDEVAAPEVWVTHGREEALVHAARQRGIRAQALALVGREEEGEG